MGIQYRNGLQESTIPGAPGNVWSMLFLSAQHMIHNDNCFVTIQMVLSPNMPMMLLVVLVFLTTLFGLGEKQGLLVGNECSSWNNKVGFSVYVNLGGKKGDCIR